jgi:hypothetical protein
MINASDLNDSKTIELAVLMRQLSREGMLRVKKAHILELVGYQNDAAGAWTLITEAFDDVGGDLDELRAMRLPDGDILFVVGSPDPMDSF